MQRDDVYAVVMAGGKGERFWPQSRISHPKQLLRLIGNLTLIEQTVERLTPLVKPENIIVITNQDYVAPMRSLLALLPEENIVGEPVGRDTAPCVALATALVKAKSGSDDSVMFILPADHVINNATAMLEVLADSATVSRQGKIVTIGVNPSFASTGYGYIHCGDRVDDTLDCSTTFYKGLGFKEKPDAKKAEEFIAEGCYRWNSGMFVWTVGTISKAFQQYTPELSATVAVLQKAANSPDFMDVLADEYEKLDKISIDYAIMEKVDNVVVGECSFDWDDVGSWTALRNQIRPESDNNVVRGLHVPIDTKDCIVVGDAKHMIATVGVEDLIIIHTDDATLVCNAKSAQRIKDLVHKIADTPELSAFL